MKLIIVGSILSSFSIIALSAFEWLIIDRITPFLYAPLAGLIWVFFIAMAIVSVTSIFRFKKLGYVSFVPIGVQIVAFLLVLFVPFTNFWLKANFFLHKSQREEVIAKVRRGDLKSNVSYNTTLIALGDSYSLVSMGGNEIVVEEHHGKKYILFYTFRGVLDNYSGFLYVPKGSDPSNFSDLNEEQSTQIEALEENWYYVSHH